MTDQDHRNSSTSDETDNDSLLTLITDDNCRDIIRETRYEALTANELAQRCDIGLSTTYRKIDSMVEAGILEERIRLTSERRQINEYSHEIDEIELSVTEAGISVAISARQTDQTSQRLGAD